MTLLPKLNVILNIWHVSRIFSSKQNLTAPYGNNVKCDKEANLVNMIDFNELLKIQKVCSVECAGGILHFWRQMK